MLLLALASAWADPVVDVVDVGLGVRQVSSPFDASPWSGHGFVRIGVAGRFAVEGGGAVRFPGEATTQIVDEAIEARRFSGAAATFRVPVAREVGGVSLVAQGSPWRRKARKKLSAWPYFAVGVAGDLVQTDVVTLNPAYTSGESDVLSVLARGSDLTVAAGPAVGLGFDLLQADRVGMRIQWLERFRVEREPDFGRVLPTGEPVPLQNVLTLSSAVSLDLLVRFR